MTAPQAGSELGPWIVESVSAEAMQHVAVALEDPNPIHLDAAAARAAGLGDRPVNQGPVNFGYVMSMLIATAPGATVRNLRVRLLANVFAEDRVVAAGRVESVEPRPGGGWSLGCAVWLDVEGRGRAIEGTATLVLP